MGYIPLGRV